jgi:hypothetical protein
MQSRWNSVPGRQGGDRNDPPQALCRIVPRLKPRDPNDGVVECQRDGGMARLVMRNGHAAGHAED